MADIVEILLLLLVATSLGFATTIGDPCTDNTDCDLPNSECRPYYEFCDNGQCRCNNASHFENSVCIPYLSLGEDCSNGDDCIPNASCDQNTSTCKCQKGYKEEGSSCVWDYNPNTVFTCTDNEDCFYSYICSEGICMCRPTMVEETECCDYHCREAQYKESCANGISCVTTFVCDQETFTCQCPPHTRLVKHYGARLYNCFNENSIFDVDLGGYCNLANDGTGVLCRDGLTCMSCGNEPSKCVRYVIPGGGDEDSTSASPGTTVSTGGGDRASTSPSPRTIGVSLVLFCLWCVVLLGGDAV